MEENHKLALYVTYYLSRFDKEALIRLGYSSWNEAFEDISQKLEVKRHSVKNWRDEFDPLFGHRAGWHQRAMIPSRVRVAQALESLDEIEIREIVKNILSGGIKNQREEEAQLLAIVLDDKKHKPNGQFILRGPTGKKAEAFFQTHFNQTFEPVKGNLIDTREWGCGYDFKIESGKRETFVEVKGLSEISGGILFTDKEWKTAQQKADNYYLAIVKNVTTQPFVSFVKNPAGIFQPQKSIYTSIQVQWSVSDKVLKNTPFS